MNNFTLSIVTPEGLLYEGQCLQAEVPGAEGIFGVLSGHMNMIAQVKAGAVCIHGSNNNLEKVIVAEGIADVSANQCTLLVEKGVFLAQTQVVEVKKKLESLQHQLLKAQSETIIEALTRECAFLTAIIENSNNSV
jgi:F-type H+-transporting ATPase subunit epsilon